MSVESIVSEKNRERTSDGRMRIALGTVYSLFTFGLVFLPSYILCYLLTPRGWAGLSALGVTAMFAGAATHSARRYVDPCAGKRGPTDSEPMSEPCPPSPPAVDSTNARDAERTMEPSANEARTRKLLIDPQIERAGWRIDDRTRCARGPAGF